MQKTSKKKGKTKEQRTTSFFRAVQDRYFDIQTIQNGERKQNKREKKNQTKKKEQRANLRNMCKRNLLMKIEQVIKIPQCKCIIFYDKNKKQKENTNETNLNVKQKQQKKKNVKT